ncbi:hypothetical protein F4778DRAFT_742186 [Xylariomycetidae sp. FL2044]|nr:hypothetical protein F4778DRAFT_742186 [Xylariomycetidae sp. FL2044]
MTQTSVCPMNAGCSQHPPPMMDPYPLTCNCWATAIRMVNSIDAPFRKTTPGGAEVPVSDIVRDMSLSDILILARDYMHCWKVCADCPGGQIHMPMSLRRLADPMGRLLTLYEAVIAEEKDSERSSSRPYRSLQGGYGWPLECKHSSTFLGGIELDLEEAAIVSLEALRDVVTGLERTQREIRDKARLYRPVDYHSRDVQRPLEEEELGETSTRIADLIRAVNRAIDLATST